MMSKEERAEKRIAKQEAKTEKKNLKEYEKYMEQALKEAQKAYNINEVPIGCVIVREDKIIANADDVILQKQFPHFRKSKLVI